jgi:two-component system CheB/CheR fusion protein
MSATLVADKDARRDGDEPDDFFPSHETRIDLRGRTILVIEDHLDSCRALNLMVEHTGANSLTARNGLDALGLVKRHKVHLILCDLRMPVMDGYEFIRRLRKDSLLARIPVIAVTAFGMDEDLQRTRRAGFLAHMVKPITWTALASLLARVLQSH